ncbi:TIGR00730 family Rossman fold protein [Ferrovibrio sp.]|uniref:LOG family protein n=1 Tax=Ferrovibrio sp. TaxID=1917215 RepID=UPI00263929DF|nr:TIGR00730 family Rossman fold protein [Ferrovibrio sp.]
MTAIRSVCVYCGSSLGESQIYTAQAQILGRRLAENGIRLIYGGGRIGLMGVVAEAALAAGGEVVGIIPNHLHDWEVGHTGLTELHVVDSMHTRKRMMVDMSDAFIAMPGGLGTLDEFFEVVTWRQLKLHDKPVIVLNTGDYWHPLLALVEAVIERGFARRTATTLFTVVDDAEAVVAALLAEPAPERPATTSRI